MDSWSMSASKSSVDVHAVYRLLTVTCRLVICRLNCIVHGRLERQPVDLGVDCLSLLLQQTYLLLNFVRDVLADVSLKHQKVFRVHHKFREAGGTNTNILTPENLFLLKAKPNSILRTRQNRELILKTIAPHIIIIIIIAFGPCWSIVRLQELSRHPNPGPVSKLVPRCNPSSLFQPLDHHHHHHCLWPLLEHRQPTRALQASWSWASLSSCPQSTPSSLFQPSDCGTRCFLGGLAFPSLWVPGQGLTSDTGHWLSEGVSSPSSSSPASLEDLILLLVVASPQTIPLFFLSLCRTMTGKSTGVSM